MDIKLECRKSDCQSARVICTAGRIDNGTEVFRHIVQGETREYISNTCTKSSAWLPSSHVIAHQVYKCIKLSCITSSLTPNHPNLKMPVVIIESPEQFEEIVRHSDPTTIY